MGLWRQKHVTVEAQHVQRPCANGPYAVGAMRLRTVTLLADRDTTPDTTSG